MLLIPLKNIKTKDAGSGYFIGKIKDTKNIPEYLEKNELVGSFKGVRSFIKYLESEMPEPPKTGYDSSAAKKEDEFNVFETYEEAMDVFKHRSGSLVKFNEIYEPVEVHEEVGNFVEYGVVGDFIDMGRYMHGIPEVFGSLHNGMQKRLRANVVINLSWVYNVNVKTIQKRLRKTLALIDWLEANNIRCSIVGVVSHHCTHVEVNLKDHDETLDLRELAVVSHSEFLRRLIFRFEEYSDTIGAGYGNARHFTREIEKIKHKERDNLDEFNLYINNDDYERDYDKKFKELRETIKDMVENNTTRNVSVL